MYSVYMMSAPKHIHHHRRIQIQKPLFQNQPCWWGWLTEPRIATNGAHDPNEKNPRTIPNHVHYFTFSLRISHSWRFGAGDTYLPTSIRAAAVPYESTPASLHIITYPCRMGQTLRICLYHGYVPTIQSCPNELYNIHGDTHATIKVTVTSEHEPYQSKIRSIRIHYGPYVY